MAAQTSLTPLQLVTPVLPLNTQTLSIDSSVLPFVIDADQNTTRVEIGIYNTTYAIDTFSLVGNFNQFLKSIALTPTISTTNVTVIGRNYDPTFAWQPGTAYAVGQRF